MPRQGETPDYWEDAKRRLCLIDPALAAVINAKGEIGLSSRGDLFATLIKAIVGQQISIKAAATVWGRVVDLIGEVKPESVLAHTHEELRSCGLSNRKAEYVAGIAEAWQDGYAEYDWDSMDDERALELLVALRGVGRWTAEMVLIFTLLRPDVFPIDDLGVVRGMEKVYNEGEVLDRAELNDIASNWSPWRTVGSWYMWRAIDPEPIEY